jgi:hypothetical protein
MIAMRAVLLIPPVEDVDLACDEEAEELGVAFSVRNAVDTRGREEWVTTMVEARLCDARDKVLGPESVETDWSSVGAGVNEAGRI